MTTLEKIRAEIEQLENVCSKEHGCIVEVLQILDKYAEQEPTIRPSFSYTAEIKADDEQLERLQGILNGEMVLRLEQEPCDDVAKERYEDLCEYFGDAKDILKSRKDFKAWLDRVKWHICKAEELYEKYEYKQETCDDAISRQAVLDGIEDLKQSPWATDKRGGGFEYLITEALDIVADLCVKQESSIRPQEQTVRKKMTLDQAIERYTNNAEYERRNGSLQGCMEFRQLAEWLKDYKRLLEQEPCDDCDYSEIVDWEQDAKTGKAKPIYWCEKHKEPCDDVVSRQAVDTLVDELARAISDERCCMSRGRGTATIMQDILDLPSVRPQEQTGHCKDCKYFEYDSVAKVDGVPLIVAHEICNKWGEGCKTKEDGFCFMFEKKEEKENG